MLGRKKAGDFSKGVRFTVGDFVKSSAGRIDLKVVAGAGCMDMVIAEPIVNRLGLALTGFYDCFAWRRVQLIGNAECSYLASLGEAESEKRFKGLLERKARLFVFTGGHHAKPSIKRLAEKSGAVIMETPLTTRVFSRLATFVLERLGAPRVQLYGTMVEVFGVGVLFEGDAGLGKSETALGLIKRGSSLIADDVTLIRKDVANNILYGRASKATEGFIEIRGIGIMKISRVFGVNAVAGERQLKLVVTFKRLGDVVADIDRVGLRDVKRNILGVELPNIIVPVSEGRDLVNLVETAVQQQKLISSGYDPVDELSEHLRKRADAPLEDKKRRIKNGR